MTVDEGAVLDGTRTGTGRDVAPDVESAVLDISALTPEDIAALPGTVLGETLRRVYDSCAEGDPFVAGHKESTPP
ncbi:FxSxx-COOH cyclophane-containing RiPP peptide [Streptomyces sp. bgisy153]|uniref:FxSxx-COOH cyclophane-containing RiPP peptide n=1 Tax=Streptomyces sp. bgisy153 TaxID=3413793 RepID=UPI003D709CA9